MPVVIDDRLIEQDYGIYEGVDRQNPDFLANKRNFAFRYPNGKSMMQVAARVYPLLEELKEKYEIEYIKQQPPQLKRKLLFYAIRCNKP